MRHDLKGKEVYVTELEKVDPPAGHVLIRVEAAPVNPADTYFIKGIYGNRDLLKPPPHTIGLEGAGQIEAVGEGLPAEELLGKKVGNL